MMDINGKKLEKGQLIFIKNLHYKNGKYFYIEGIDIHDKMIYGKRVNKNMTFDRYDKDNNNKKYILITSDTVIEIIESPPDRFKEALRTLYFFIDEVLGDFGVLFSKKDHYILRAVQYEKGSYGIVQNQLYFDNSYIDNRFEIQKVYVDLTYDELKEKWERIKTRRMNIEWIESFNV